MKKYLLIYLIIFGCNRSTIKTQNSFTFKEFPLTERITLTPIIQNKGGVIAKILLTDSSLITYDWMATNGFFFQEYALASKQKTMEYLPLGRKPGSSLGALSTGLFNQYLWMFDINLNKIILVSLKQDKTQPIIYKEVPFNKFYYSLQFIDSLTVIGNGYYNTPNVIQEIDLLSGKVKADYGELDAPPKGVPPYAWKRANEGPSAIRPDGKKLAIAHLWSDKLEIFDLLQKTRRIISGPENFKADFASFKSEGQDYIHRTENSTNAFSVIVGTQKYIYALFSGNNMSSPYINYGKRIFVYDWDGKPIKELKLTDYASCFAVSDNDTQLYVYNITNHYITSSKLK
jgi:hypothetical protein